jgi:hypothetical protein
MNGVYTITRGLKKDTAYVEARDGKVDLGFRLVRDYSKSSRCDLETLKKALMLVVSSSGL